MGKTSKRKLRQDEKIVAVVKNSNGCIIVFLDT